MNSDSTEIVLTPEETIEWLEAHRMLMIEIWENNPDTRAKWEKNNGF